MRCTGGEAVQRDVSFLHSVGVAPIAIINQDRLDRLFKPHRRRAFRRGRAVAERVRTLPTHETEQEREICQRPAPQKAHKSSAGGDYRHTKSTFRGRSAGMDGFSTGRRAKSSADKKS